MTAKAPSSIRSWNSTPSGNFVKAFGAGKILFPHGLTIDKDDHIWITDNHVGDGIGDDVLEFDQNGNVLRTLGTPGRPATARHLQ